jgi:hypothetical protein
MDPHPDLESERLGGVDDRAGAADGLGGPQEGHEEAVPCCPDLAASIPLEVRSDDGAMCSQQISPAPVPQRRTDTRGVDHVGQKDRHQLPVLGRSWPDLTEERLDLIDD